MGDRPRLLDLFSGAGGSAVGYHRAGFDVVGVDCRPMPRYPFEFHQADALEYLAAHGHEFEAVHASPPCQRYSRARHTPGSRGRDYPDLLPATLDALRACRLPWVVENVPGAPLPWGVTLCGTVFGLRLRRHRVFTASFPLLLPGNGCRHRPGDLTVFGHCVQVTASHGTAYLASSGRTHYRPLRVSSREGGVAMGVDWMTRGELSQALPPVFCEFIGRQLMRVVRPDAEVPACP
jgi:DNA (cytosine-5)-methyltransferase 1